MNHAWSIHRGSSNSTVRLANEPGVQLVRFVKGIGKVVEELRFSFVRDEYCRRNVRVIVCRSASGGSCLSVRTEYETLSDTVVDSGNFGSEETYCSSDNFERSGSGSR